MNGTATYFLPLAMSCVCLSGMASAQSSSAPLAVLGEPKRSVMTAARPVEHVLAAHAWALSGTGVVPVMIFPSNALVVENIYAPVKSEAVCKSAFGAYDSKVRAQHGSKIKHRLLCVSVANGKIKGVMMVAKSY